LLSEVVNPLSIDPNERVTPNLPSSSSGGPLLKQSILHGDNRLLSLGEEDTLELSDVGLIPPPPMFCGPLAHVSGCEAALGSTEEEALQEEDDGHGCRLLDNNSSGE
jgi:hypothetical protein